MRRDFLFHKAKAQARPGWVRTYLYADPTHRLTVRGIPKSQNEIGRGKEHWGDAQRRTQEWRVLVRESLGAQGPPQEPFHRADVHLRFHFPTAHRRDPDNYAGGSKPLIDALVYWGLIEDDSFDHISLTLSQGEPDRNCARTEVTVTERREQ